MNEQETVQTDHASAPPSETAGAPTEDQVLEALKNVFDPELGINIVDLGLVYDVKVDAHGDIDITYSLTTMGCPIGPMIEDQMRGFLRGRSRRRGGAPRDGDPAPVEPRDDVGRGQGRARHLLRPARRPRPLTSAATRR